MSDPYFGATTEARTLEVRIRRGGRMVGRELCESEEQALLAVQAWSEFDGVECEVAPLSGGVSWGDGETEPFEQEPDDYPEELDIDRAADEAMRVRD